MIKAGTLLRIKRGTVFAYDVVATTEAGSWWKGNQATFPRGTVMLYLGIKTFSENGCSLHSFLGPDSKKYYRGEKEPDSDFPFDRFEEIKT